MECFHFLTTGKSNADTYQVNMDQIVVSYSFFLSMDFFNDYFPNTCTLMRWKL